MNASETILCYSFQSESKTFKKKKKKSDGWVSHMACVEKWFQAKRMAGAEVLRVRRAWFVWGTERRPYGCFSAAEEESDER